MSRYVRKSNPVEAAQVVGDLMIGGVQIPAGHWVALHDDGRITSWSDADFRAEYEPEPVADGVDAAQPAEPAPPAAELSPPAAEPIIGEPPPA